MQKPSRYTAVRPTIAKYGYHEEKDGYRELFLMAVSKKTPVVLKELVHRVFPAYAQEFWTEAKRRGENAVRFDNCATRHEKAIRTWMQGETDRSWWNWYGEVRSRLLDWCRRHNLQAEWLLKRALDSMAYWSCSPDMYCPKRKTVLSRNGRPILWPILPTSYFPSDWVTIKRAFEYPAWPRCDWRSYEQLVRSAFEKHLEQYRREVQKTVRGMKRLKTTKLEYFELLALYRCENLSPEGLSEQIGEPWYSKDPSVIFRHVQAATKLVGGLPPKPAGPPRRSKRR